MGLIELGDNVFKDKRIDSRGIYNNWEILYVVYVFNKLVSFAEK